MEKVDKRIRRGRKSPKVPIETYKWEDLRRSRRRGGYPWTHLYKEPLYEHLDPEPWTMEGMRKAKSSSTMGKSDDFSISEVTTFDNRSSVDDEVLDDPSVDIKDMTHSMKTTCSSLNLEEQEIDDDIERAYEVIDKEEIAQTPGMFFLHSEESSDDISQYLDKEERVPSQDSKASQDQLKPESEISAKKRKLSAESGNSKLSLGKKAFIQKLKGTTEKIKAPKLTFPTKLKKPILKKTKNSPPQIKKPTQSSTAASSNKKPVYIHIPLKPPPGETDEYSHLENEPLDSLEKEAVIKKPASFRDLVKNIKHLQEPTIEHKHPSPIREVKEEEPEDSHNKELVDDTVRRLVAEEHVFEIEKKEIPEESKITNGNCKASDEVITKIEVSEDFSEGKSSPVNEAPDEDYFNKLFEASTSRERTNSQKQSRTVRSKSAEPERKRKASLESSYSRKSLSKLGFLKKLRDAKDKLKSSLSRTTSKKDVKEKNIPKNANEKDKEKDNVDKPKVQLKPKKHVEPVYIHIPLKPPEGETDQFSHLKYEAPIAVAPKHQELQSEDAPESSIDTPDVPPDVQLIILTAPSDDEILDYNSSDVPETPVSESKPFFPLKVNELKKIAKDAIDVVTNGTTSNKLASVAEENGKNSQEEQTSKEPEEDKKVEHMTIDEEDGLSEAKKDEKVVEEKIPTEGVKDEIKIVEQELTTTTDDTNDNNAIKVDESASCNEDANNIDKPEEVIKTTTEEKATNEEKPELKSVLKAPNSPVMKKKVSFKRKSKSKSSEEETDKPEVKEDIVVTENSTDLKDDEKRNEKWSETNDHEPEHLKPPVNTELQTINLNNTPAVVISTEEAMGLSDQENYNLSTKHVYEEISEGNHKKPLKTQKVAFSATTDSRSSEASEKEPPKESRGKFQAAFKQKASNFKTKLQSIKKPHITLPERPKFQKPNLQRFKIEKPKWTMPKMPDTAKLSLPHFSLPKKGAKKPVKRISSTESTSGGSKKITFDFGTYPRIFKRKSKPDVQAPQFATVPRAKKTDSSKSTEDSRRSATDSIRIPLHSEDSTDKDELNSPVESSDLIEPSHIRYSEGIDSEDEYERETKEVMEERDFLSRWQRGRFNPDEFEDDRRQPKVTDLDSPSEDKDFSSNNGNEPNYSSSSSVAVHRQGVLEEINPDEFFLRQKGISQDNIEVGMYLSTEIREAFRNPMNSLAQMEENNFNTGSHHSLPELQNKRKPIKKPKRKKTPHASQERIPYGEEETADEETDAIPPSRPKRRSKKKKKTNEEFIPYQETIQVDLTQDERLTQHRESLGILADDEQDFTYENEIMEGIEQPEIKITDPYKNYGEDEIEDEDIENGRNEPEEDLYVPEAPPRLKPKNIKSLKTFEMGSAIQTFEVVSTIPKNKKVPERMSYHTKEKEVNEYPQITSHEFNITEPEMSRENFNNYRYMDESIEDLPPPAPPRKHKSVKSLTISENESLPGDLMANRMVFSSEKTLEEPQIDAIRTESKIIIPIEPEIQPPIPPLRSRSRGNSKSRTGSRAASESRTIPQEDNNSVNQQEDLAVPCIEEPCTQTICDYMGYTTVDRNKPRDPPLPPPRSLQRKKKPKRKQESHFFTMPRTKSQEENDTPVRPSRIYSTIVPTHKADTENKENLDIDILQYIEQDTSNNGSRNLQSGEVIEKIKVRPLPTPPRPPRKLKPLADITSRENIAADSTEDIKKSTTGESEMYTQTEPLPEDFVCEEVVQEPTDRVIIPSQTAEGRRVKRELITPTMFTHEETITHGSLIVEPLNGARILPDSDFSEIRKEKIIPVHVESDNEETSSIPDEFHKLSDPVVENKPTSITNQDGKEVKKSAITEMDVLKANKLQVIDLDVDTLTVNRLLAGKIVVSEIDSNSIQTNEISSKTGSSRVADISLPPEVLEQIVKTIQSNYTSQEQEKPQCEDVEQKKTPIEPSPIIQPTVEPCPEEALEISTNQNVEEPVTSEEERISDLSLPETVPLEESPKEPPTVFPELQEVPLLTNPEITKAAEDPQADEAPPHRPPRQSERLKASQSTTEVSMQEPEVDDEPPPRPPHLPLGYMPSQPPVSFYALRAQKYVEDNIPAAPRRRRHARSKHMARSSSEDSSDASPVARRLHRHSGEPSVAQLTGQLARACGSRANDALKRLINYILNNVFHNEDGKQDLNVMIIIVLVLIAGLLLLGYGEERTVIHLHHWEYFNPPKDL